MEAELIIVVHEEAFIGSSPGIIKFDVGQILGDPVDLRSCLYDAHVVIQE